MPEGKYISFYFVIESIGQHYKTKTDSLNIKILCVAILLRWRNLLTLTGCKIKPESMLLYAKTNCQFTSFSQTFSSKQ